MGYFKNLEIEIREMDFQGMPVQEIANRVGLDVRQIIDLLDNGIDDGEFKSKETVQ
jgi:hypothetical protein